MGLGSQVYDLWFMISNPPNSPHPKNPLGFHVVQRYDRGEMRVQIIAANHNKLWDITANQACLFPLAKIR